MSDRQFRFGVVAADAGSGEQWSGLARRVEALGYATLLVPDTARTLAPMPAATMAAAATETLRVGTYVLAAGLRPPAVVAWEAATLDTLTGGRFELGLGVGRPEAERDAEQFGLPATTTGQRVALLTETLRTVHARGGPRLLVAGAGPRVLTAAAQYADTIAIGLPPAAGEKVLAEKVRLIQDAAGERAGQIELNGNLLAVGHETPPWLHRHLGVDVATLLAQGSIAVLAGTPREMADVLTRRRDTFGVSYLCTNAGFMEQLAPVVELLAGR